MSKLTGLLCGLAVVALAAPTHAREEIDYSNTLVVVACQVDDMTGKRDPSHDGVEVRPAPGWKDLELRENKYGEFTCKRVVVNQHDAKVSVQNDVRKTEGCMRSSMLLAPQWNEDNPGWAVVAIGCPTPIINDLNNNGQQDDDEPVIGYKLPECPRWIKCDYNESEI